MAERKQHELELRYHALFEQINDAIVLIGPDRKILAINKRMEELSGYTADELVGEPVMTLISLEDLEDAEAKQNQRTSGVQLPVYERTIRRKDGETFSMEINIVPVKDKDENLLYYQGSGRDIRERRRAEVALEESEYRYRALFEQNNDGVFLIDLDGMVRNLNPRMAELLGYQVEELMGRPRRAIIAPDEYPDAENKLARLLEGKAVPTYERNLLHKSGKTIPMEINLTLVLDSNRNPVGAQSIVRDISERKKTEEIIQESISRYRALFEQSGDAIFIINAEGFITDVNHQVMQLFGYEYGEILGKRPEDLVPDSEKQACSDKLKMALLGMQPPIYERIFQRKDGALFPGEIHLSPVRGTDRKVRYVQSIVRDISPRKAAERALQESGHRYQTLFSQSLDAIFITGLDGTVLDANPGAAKMLGYEVEEMKGLHARVFSAPDEKTDTDNVISKLLAGEALPPYERLALRKDGTVFPVEIRAVLVRDADGNPLYIQSTSHNISERKNIEQQLHYLATHDPLTGLPNRSLFFDRLQQALARARRTELKVAILFIDLDGFKQVNDTYGHAIGDRILEAITKRLETCFRESDTLARMGGDEFTLILENITDLEQAISLSERVLSSLKELFLVQGHEISVSASMGLSLFPEDGEDGELLVNRADNAMYAAKHTGKGGLVIYQYLNDIRES